MFETVLLVMWGLILLKLVGLIGFESNEEKVWNKCHLAIFNYLTSSLHQVSMIQFCILVYIRNESHVVTILTSITWSKYDLILHPSWWSKFFDFFAKFPTNFRLMFKNYLINFIFVISLIVINILNDIFSNKKFPISFQSNQFCIYRLIF